MKLKPLYDMIIVKPDKPIEQIGNIHLPPNAAREPKTGTVVAVGYGRICPDGSLRELIVKPGDRVRYDDYAGTLFQYKGETYLYMRENAVMGIIIEEDEE